MNNCRWKEERKREERKGAGPGTRKELITFSDRRDRNWSVCIAQQKTRRVGKGNIKDPRGG